MFQDLRLQEEGRELIYKGALNKRGGVQGDSGDLQLYLFDHALLMVKQKTKHEQYKVYRRVSVKVSYNYDTLLMWIQRSQYHWSSSLYPPTMTMPTTEYDSMETATPRR